MQKYIIVWQKNLSFIFDFNVGINLKRGGGVWINQQETFCPNVKYLYHVRKIFISCAFLQTKRPGFEVNVWCIDGNGWIRVDLKKKPGSAKSIVSVQTVLTVLYKNWCVNDKCLFFIEQKPLNITNTRIRQMSFKQAAILLQNGWQCTS